MPTAAPHIVVLIPTWIEARPFVLAHGDTVEVFRCGMGSLACAEATIRTIRRRRPDRLVLAGIAGARDRALPLCRSLLVEQENLAALGSLRDGGFHPLAAHDTPERNGYRCSLPDGAPFRSVVSDTVETAGTPYRSPLSSAAIENMEGAGFFAVCRTFGVPFTELRCLSNYVGDPFAQWRLGEATERLAADLVRLLEWLHTTPSATEQSTNHP